MASVVSTGTTDRIAARTCSNVLRAGSGMPARYSSTLLLFFATLTLAERRAPDIVFFIGPIPTVAHKSTSKNEKVVKKKLGHFNFSAVRTPSLRKPSALTVAPASRRLSRGRLARVARKRNEREEARSRGTNRTSSLAREAVSLKRYGASRFDITEVLLNLYHSCNLSA